MLVGRIRHSVISIEKRKHYYKNLRLVGYFKFTIQKNNFTSVKGDYIAKVEKNGYNFYLPLTHIEFDNKVYNNKLIHSVGGSKILSFQLVGNKVYINYKSNNTPSSNVRTKPISIIHQLATHYGYKRIISNEDIQGFNIIVKNHLIFKRQRDYLASELISSETEKAHILTQFGKATFDVNDGLVAMSSYSPFQVPSNNDESPIPSEIPLPSQTLNSTEGLVSTDFLDTNIDIDPSAVFDSYYGISKKSEMIFNEDNLYSSRNLRTNEIVKCTKDIPPYLSEGRIYEVIDSSGRIVDDEGYSYRTDKEVFVKPNNSKTLKHKHYKPY